MSPDARRERAAGPALANTSHHAGDNRNLRTRIELAEALDAVTFYRQKVDILDREHAKVLRELHAVERRCSTAEGDRDDLERKLADATGRTTFRVVYQRAGWAITQAKQRGNRASAEALVDRLLSSGGAYDDLAPLTLLRIDRRPVGRWTVDETFIADEEPRW
jgi:hypothetical protein